MTEKDAITLVLADDHPLLLAGVRNFIDRQIEFQIVETCHDGPSALAAIRKLRPMIAVIDVRMPGCDGIEILSTLTAENSPTRVVLLTASVQDEQIYVAMEADVAGIVLKKNAPDTLVECLHEVAAGRHWFPDPFVQEAVRREAERRKIGSEIARKLTARERELLLLAAQDLSNKEIARKVDIAEGTAKLHMHSIYQKLGVFRRSALSELAERYMDQLKTPE